MSFCTSVFLVDKWFFFHEQSGFFRNYRMEALLMMVASEVFSGLLWFHA